jgi:predicted MFS family arabinose efflux permease
VTEGTSYRWKILVVAYLISFTFGLTLQSVPPVLSLLIREFGLTHTEAGLTMSLFALPMVFLSIPAGLLADRYGPRSVGLVAFLVAVVGGLLSALSQSFAVLLAGRALTGIGVFTLVLIAPQLVSQWFLGKELGMAMGIWNTAFPLGTILSLVTMGSIGQALGWRAPMLIAVGVAVLAMFVFGLLARPAPLTADRARHQGSFRSAIIRAGLPIWLVGAAWLFFNASTLSFMAFGPDYFQSVGYAVAKAGLFSSMMLWGALVVAPAVGLLLDRGWRAEALICAGALGLALALFLIPTNPSLVVPILVLTAVVNSFIVVSIFALPPTLLEPSLLGLGYGILATCLNIGTTLGPLVAGLARDLSGSYTTSFWAMAVMAVLISASTVPLIVTRRAAPASAAFPE